MFKEMSTSSVTTACLVPRQWAVIKTQPREQSIEPAASFVRLASALRTALKKTVVGTTPMGAALGESPQTCENWKRRGVSADGAIAAQRRYSINSVWVMFGEGDMFVGGKSQSERLSDSTMDRTVDILNVLAAARPGDDNLNPVTWATISKAARAVERSTTSDQRQLFAEVLSCLEK